MFVFPLTRLSNHHKTYPASLSDASEHPPNNNFRTAMPFDQYETKTVFKITRYQIRAASIPLDLNRACHSKEESLMPPRHRNGSNFLAFRFHTQKAYIPIIPRYKLKNISAQLLINNHVGSWMCCRQRYTKPVPPKFSEVNVSNVKYDLNQMRVYEGPWC